jgi:uncharacterized peroxidase-related enzyme
LTATQADELTHRLATNWELAGLSPADQALCRFANVLTDSPHSTTESHILDVRQHGFDDDAIHDATQVISYFNYINRIASGLNVDMEPDIHAWELSPPINK